MENGTGSVMLPPNRPANVETNVVGKAVLFEILAGLNEHLVKLYECTSASGGRGSGVGERPAQRNLLPCQVCSKTFDRPSLLKRHMRTHTGEKPHICSVCSKGFSTSSSLNTHRRIHTGEKPHKCPECGKCFTASSNLYYHRMTHTKNKPHKCTWCPRSFPTPGELRAHTTAHTTPHAEQKRRYVIEETRRYAHLSRPKYEAFNFLSFRSECSRID